jgi:hypothetical protein
LIIEVILTQQAAMDPRKPWGAVIKKQERPVIRVIKLLMKRLIAQECSEESNFSVNNVYYNDVSAVINFR